MNIQQINVYLDEFLSKCNKLNEINDLKKVLHLLQCDERNEVWRNSALDLMDLLTDTYPTFKYNIVKHRDGRCGKPDYVTTADWLSIAGMCIMTDLYVEATKNR